VARRGKGAAGSASARQPAAEPVAVLGALPAGLRDELVRALNQIIRNYRENRWEPAELNGGKLCEVTYSILRGYVDGNMPASASKPKDMVTACRAFENAPTSFPRSVRILIPRTLMALYEIRNNRGVGHVGGDVDPNHMDAVMVLGMSKWVVAELIRIFHQVDTATATAAVDSLIEREMPVIWSVDGKKRVLDTGLGRKDKTLLLLYSESEPVSEADLVSWLETPSAAAYRRDILRPAHEARLIEYDGDVKTAQLSPRGIRYVEDKLSLTLLS
jgi:hypothetical protein